MSDKEETMVHMLLRESDMPAIAQVLYNAGYKTVGGVALEKYLHHSKPEELPDGAWIDENGDTRYCMCPYHRFGLKNWLGNQK